MSSRVNGSEDFLGGCLDLPVHSLHDSVGLRMMGQGGAMCNAEHRAELGERLCDEAWSIVRGDRVRGAEHTPQMQESIASRLRRLIWAREENGKPGEGAYHY